MRVGDVCNSAVVSVRSDESVVEAARKMRRFHVGDLIVTSSEEPHPKPIGVITDRDVALVLVAQDLPDLEGLTVGDVVRTDELVGVDADEDVFAAIQRMRENGVRRLPVTDDRNVLVGVFTLDDALAHLVEQLSALVGVTIGQRIVESERRP